MRDTLIRNINDVVSQGSNTQVGFTSKNSRQYWEIARPMGYSSFRYRCKATWLVFTGKADALKYVNQ